MHSFITGGLRMEGIDSFVVCVPLFSSLCAMAIWTHFYHTP